MAGLVVVVPGYSVTVFGTTILVKETVAGVGMVSVVV